MAEFFASIYHTIYLLVVAVITLVYLPQYVHSKTHAADNNATNDNAYFLLIAVTLFIGLRPVSGVYFVDMIAYDDILKFYSHDSFQFSWDTDNKIFDNLILWFSSSKFDRKLFFLLMAALYFGAIYWGLKRLFPTSTKLAFLTYLAGFSTFSYSVNGIKAGVAASIFILALSFRDKKLICAILMLVSLGFHHSMVLPIASCIIAFVVKSPKFFYGVWVFSLLMCALHITYFQSLFAGMSDEQGAGYLMATSETTTSHIGFRPDFILYSAVPVAIGYYFEIRSRYQLSKMYKFLIHFYTLANAIWMLCMYASFTNRIAYLSWFVYPIVLIYPFLDRYNTDNFRYQRLALTVRCHLFFTLFMVFIYYALFNLGR